MPRYRKKFRKTIHGYYEVDADNPEHADAKFQDGDYYQFDNKEDSEEDDNWVAE